MIIPNIADFNHNNNPVNFTEIAAAGIWGVIMKARQGLGFKDPAYAKRYAAAKSVGLLVAAYDFATHDVVADNVASAHRMKSDFIFRPCAGYAGATVHL